MRFASTPSQVPLAQSGGTAPTPAQIKIADMNLDGKLDVIVSTLSGSISIHRGNGDGTFAAPSNYTFGSSDSSQTADFLVQDLNGDSKPDVVVLDTPGNKIHALRGRGDGTLEPSVAPETGAQPIEVVSGDYNNDGVKDFMVTHRGASFMSLYLLRANGEIASRHDYQVGSGASGLTTADFNNDGVQDIGYARGNNYSISTSTWPSLQTGTRDLFFSFTGPKTFKLTPSSVPSLALIYTTAAVVYPVATTTTFTPQTLGASPKELEFADMDNDGKPDLLSAHSTGNITVSSGLSSGVFETAKSFPCPGALTRLEAGDLNNDGMQDVVAIGGSSAFTVMLQEQYQITSAASTTFEEGFNGSFTFTTQATDPAPSFWSVGRLPAGVILHINGTLSGTPEEKSAGSYPVTVSASSGGSVANQNFTLHVSPKRVPVVSTLFFPATITSRSITMGGSVDDSRGFPITARGFVYARTAVNPNPQLGGNGVTVVADPIQDTGYFSHTANTLEASTAYTFSTYATNSRGTAYAPPTSFETKAGVGSGSLIVTTLTDENNGSSDPGLGTGTSLREAIGYANQLSNSQEITFLPSLFANGPATISASQFLINNTGEGMTTITGPGADKLIIDGNYKNIFSTALGGLTLKGMTLTRGGTSYAVTSYYGLYAYDCVFSDCREGAIYAHVDAVVERCSFINNSRTLSGGAIHAQAGLKVFSSTFYNNRSDGRGGAIYYSGGSSSSRVAFCTFTGNSAQVSGGGLDATFGNLSMSNSIVSGNTAPTGPDFPGNLNPNFYHNLIGGSPAAIFATGLPAMLGGTTPVIALKRGGPAERGASPSFLLDSFGQPLLTDQRGKPRVVAGGSDLGAFQLQLEATLGPATVTVAGNAATFGGSVTAGEPNSITRRGVVFAIVSQNATPALGGAGVTVLDAAATAGAFTLPVSNLIPHTNYAYATFFMDDSGTTYSPVGSFQTKEARGLVVTLATDGNDSDNQTSLREAVVHANSLGGPQTITFAPALAGQTIVLGTPWSSANANEAGSALSVTGDLTIQGLSGNAGITLQIATGASLRHLFVNAVASLVLTDLTLKGGVATSPDGEYGGSVWSQGSLTVRGCTFIGNTAGREGGAIQCWGDSPFFLAENCTFSGNASHGVAGAIDTGAQQSTLRHLTITNNTATSGHAVVLWKYMATLVNCLIAGNPNDGIGLSLGGWVSPESTNNLIGPGGSGWLTNGERGNLVGVPASELYLGTLGLHGGPVPTIPLLPGSPALNAGAASNIAADPRGVPRRALASGGLLGRYYKLGSSPTTALLAPLANIEALPHSAITVTPRIDFGAGTESQPGNGSVLDRSSTGGNLFGGLGINLGSDNLAAFWNGYITVPETATYRFSTRSDDGSVLYINEQLVVANNQLQPTTSASGSIHLTAGRHAIRVGYFEGTGDSIVQASWQQLDGSAPFARQIIPPQVLSWGSAPDIGAYEFAEEELPALERWRALHGLASNGSQDGGNPSGDGVGNLLKYAFNMAPVAGDLTKMNLGILPLGGSAGLPRIWRNEEGHLVIEFVRRKAATSPGITYSVETGASPGLFQVLAVGASATSSIDGTWERVTFVDPTAGTTRFGRVRVTVW